MKRELYVPKGVGCCANHLTSENKLNEPSIQLIQRSNDFLLEGDEVQFPR
jgi:hypothetical protein